MQLYEVLITRLSVGIMQQSHHYFKGYTICYILKKNSARRSSFKYPPTMSQF